MPSKDRPEIVYPCQWSFKVIGEKEEHLRSAINDVVKNKDYQIKHSMNSRGGKYVSLELTLMVRDEAQRNYYFQQLNKHDVIKFVL